MDQTMAVQTRPAREGLGHNQHAKMRLTARPRSGMSGMTGRFIVHFEPGRLKGVLKPVSNSFNCVHEGPFAALPILPHQFVRSGPIRPSSTRNSGRRFLYSKGAAPIIRG